MSANWFATASDDKTGVRKLSLSFTITGGKPNDGRVLNAGPHNLIYQAGILVPKSLRGAVASIDAAGNLVTDLEEAQLEGAPRDESLRIICGGHETLGLHSGYADQPELTFVAIINDAGKLELGIVGENAAAMLSIPAGASVEVRWDAD